MIYRIISCLLVTTSLIAQPGQGQVPDLTLNMLNGERIHLYSLLEEGPLLIDFWATWCEPCKKEMKHLNVLHQKYSDQNFKVLTINQDSPRSMSKVKSYLRTNKFTFLVAVDPNQQISQKLNARLLPTTILVNQNGEIVWRHQGYLPGDEIEIENQILQVLQSDSSRDEITAE